MSARTDTFVAFANLSVTVALVAFVAFFVYDMREFSADMERMGRECAAAMFNQPYVGKTCQQLLTESKGIKE